MAPARGVERSLDAARTSAYATLLIYGCFLGGRGLGRGQMKVHSVILTFFDADGSRFKLRSSRLRIGGVDGELIGRYLVVVMDRHEGEAGPQTGIEPDGSDH